LDDGVNKIFVLRAQMCEALEVAPLALFTPPWENSADIHIIKSTHLENTK
jgi:hypothetical protein